jgi:hypothetical protein
MPEPKVLSEEEKKAWLDYHDHSLKLSEREWEAAVCLNCHPDFQEGKEDDDEKY